MHYYVNKLRQNVGLETWKWRQIVTSQTAHQIQMTSIWPWTKTPSRTLSAYATGCRCWGWRCRGVLWGFPPTPHSIGDPSSAPHVRCYCQMNWCVVVRRVQMGVSIWGAVHLHSMDRWALSGAGVYAPCRGLLETVWLHCDELSRLDACEDWKVVRWCRTQASSHNSQGVVNSEVNKAGVITATPDRRAVFSDWMHQGKGGYSQRCCSSTPTGASKPP